MRVVGMAAALVLAAAGCGSSPADAAADEAPLACAQGEEAFRGACVDPARRYEPAARLDADNVVAYGDAPTELELPEPPRSGFRIVAPPRTLGPGEEDELCLSWPFPAFTNRVVYAARLYATSGLHHSNLIAKPVDPATGAQPYPSCHPGAADPFARLPEVIPDVLFANSTQVTGEETLAFPPGKGYRLDPTREMVTDIHFLNTGQDAQRVEVAYDFFTMPEAELTDEVAPFALQVDDFDIPPHATGEVGTTCTVYGGEVVALMPHTHKLATAFTADLVANGVPPRRVMDVGPFDAQSHIQVFDPPLDLGAVDRMAFQCTFGNTTDHHVVYGIGENEMCVLFGYVYPPRSQFVAHAPTPAEPCQSVEIGLFR